MGRDLTLYPKEATREQLKEYVEGLGFSKCQHFWDWPAGTLNYSWFDDADFKSIDGVSADIYPVSGDELDITGNEWALHVRNLYSASWHDVKMLNEVLRGARKRFGGTIKGDYGTNRYAPLWDDDSTPISRGITKVYQHVSQEIRAVKFALPDPIHQQTLPDDKKIADFIEFTNSMDPRRTIYNGLVPFAVAMFEYFFSQVFKVLIAYDHTALKKRAEHKQKLDFAVLLEIAGNERTIEDVIASNYTFQNISQLNKAYKDWLGIDVRALLYRKRKIGNTISFLETRVSDIIQYRHGIVHRFEIDRSLTKEKFTHILEAIEKTMAEFVSHLELRYSMKIEID
ncbi:hypothetical protein [Halochromatium glycolicum]|jgi:hypothetical protein|uniref:RiboL-PSP-HEPN domain-containing protein n=1 Tax=Halochromatium glycolicum TaxID=85075 RepID=A0AAJ0U743_9GAMM|nr:hypothetical protein [Halochromatium glycolicum]MBK1706560.1 hypothetical protein [Halochromatium glycolicum]